MDMLKWGVVPILSMVLVSCASTPPIINNDPFIETSIPLLMAKAKIPGIAIATINNCEVDSTLFFGVEDIESGKQVGPNTIFEAASLTKPIFAYLVMQLVDEGVIDLDAPLARDFDYPRIVDNETYAMLTPRLILSHQSGLRNWYSDPLDPETWGEINFKNQPGEEFGYSGEAYQLLQAYVEDKTGLSLDDLYKERLGAQMTKTSLSTVREGISKSFGHDTDGAKVDGRAMIVPDHAGAAFSANSNAADYALFVSRLCSGDGLSDAVASDMLMAQSPTSDVQISWGLGVGVQQTGERRVHFHWGDNEQFKAFWALDRDAGTGVVFFANAHHGLMMIEPLAEPIVGNVDAIIDWLDYGRIE